MAFIVAAPSGAAIVRSDATCNPQRADCSTLVNKVPAVGPPMHGPLAATAALGAADRSAFEHLLGYALRDTEAVAWVTRAFAARILRFVVEGAALNGTSDDTALTAAFITDRCGPTNTGYVGPSLSAIRKVLNGQGNIREVWGLMYVLTKTHYVTHLLHDLLAQSHGTPPLATPESLAARFGMNASAVSERWRVYLQTNALNDTSLEYAQGMPDFEFESFNSWVRFDFDATDREGAMLWAGARVRREGGCSTVQMRSDDPSIRPPLSQAEIAYQCGSKPPPCMLQWQPGSLCYELRNVSWTLADGEVVPGVTERAARLGYRTAAAVSGTTANMLQLARLLGFRAEELVVLRATMAAWMLVTDDHSFFEIMLGAEPYMPQKLGVVFGLEDLGQLWPVNVSLATSGGRFAGAELWRRVGKRLDTKPGSELLARMAPQAQEYVRGLVTAARDECLKFDGSKTACNDAVESVAVGSRGPTTSPAGSAVERKSGSGGEHRRLPQRTR